MTAVFVGIGSNLNNPRQQIRQAIESMASLPETELLATSPSYQSAPLGPQDQPDYVNAVVQLSTNLAAEALLDELQTIENAQGRERNRHWGERTLDLDILLFGEQTICSERLTVPHPHMTERDFVLQPLLDISPNATLPDGKPLSDLLDRCHDHQLQRLAV